MALSVHTDKSVLGVDWSNIDTVLLDMDGTLLDLRFDTEFWTEIVPATYAQNKGIDVAAAKAFLNPIHAKESGHLNWYCLDFWSSIVEFDIAQLKQQHAANISWRPEAENFLRRLRASHCEVVLVTNAHPDTLRIKLEQVHLEPWLDKIFTSHSFGAPKEYQAFWQQLQMASAFEPQRTLFIDDSESVLASAEAYGVKHLITLRQPDSGQGVRAKTRYPAVLHFDELFKGLPSFDG